MIFTGAVADPLPLVTLPLRSQSRLLLVLQLLLLLNVLAYRRSNPTAVGLWPFTASYPAMVVLVGALMILPKVAAVLEIRFLLMLLLKARL